MRWLRALLFALGLCAIRAGGQDRISPEDLLLARIRLDMGEKLKRQPNYTCLETIERTTRAAGARTRVQDTLRLEVAIVNGKEMFAWPGSKKFEDRDLRELVTTGTFGNGNYAIHARTVFWSDVPQFSYGGETELLGQRAVRYDFRVARAVSNYTLRVNDDEDIVGYHGSFWADPETLRVLRLEVVADDIPKRLGVDATGDRVDFAEVAIGGESFLLPSESVLDMKTGDQESRNYTRFTGCRQYTGESVLSFEDLPETAVPDAVRVAEVALPKDALVAVRLSQAIPLADIAVGDPIPAELRSDIRQSKQVVAPKGARATGRITRITQAGSRIVVGVTFTDLNWEGSHAALTLASEPGLNMSPQQARAEKTGIRPEPGEALLVLEPRGARLDRGMLFYWRTR